ncbi:MAG: hypothetical protein ATN31_10650 [Candidatus Epulonipiscioides saccharophilum]|nr:MAG: hypothetical protein ATN31_10650 [Epulopiscium sp. AS2M-Bin001]
MKKLSALMMASVIAFSSVSLFAAAPSTKAEPHPIKVVKAEYGSPVIEADIKVVDPIWKNILPISFLQIKKGEITEETEFPSIKTMWNEDYVFILAEIDDSEIYKNVNPAMLHESDFTELYFNPLKDRSNATYDDTEFWIKIHPDGTFESHENAPEGIVYSAFTVEGGYVTQVKIPHELYEAKAGETIGFDFQIGDASAATGKRDIILGWNDTVNSAWKNPSVVGELMFNPPVAALPADMTLMPPVNPQ